MRILYFSRDYTTHDHRFLRSLAESDHEVYFLRLERSQRQLEDRPLPESITNIAWIGGNEPYRGKKLAAYVSEFKKVVRKVRPDLVHAGPVQTCGLIAALAGIRPLVTMSWGSDLLKDASKNLWNRWATRYTLKRTTVLVGDCQAVKQKAAEFGFPKEYTVLFPWGIDLNRFYPRRNETFRERRGWQDKFVILSLRSWEPIYGVDVVANGFVQAARENPDLRLILLGGGSQAGLIRSILENGNVNDRVFFGGQVSQAELPGYYQAADLYISASHSDGSSVSLMEALASGLPVLVSDIPGNLEWVKPDREGWLFPDGDANALARSINEISSDRENLKRQAENARERAKQRADWQKNFKKLLNAYSLAHKLVRR